MSGDPEAPSPGASGADRSRHQPPAASPPEDPDRRERSTAARFAGVGLQFALTILVSLWLGTWLDRKLGTAPVFLYIGVFLGAGGAFYSMYRQLMANLERDEAARRARTRAAAAPSPDSGESGEPRP